MCVPLKMRMKNSFNEKKSNSPKIDLFVSIHKLVIFKQIATTDLFYSAKALPSIFSDPVLREHLGLPEDWQSIEKWARKHFCFSPPLEEYHSKEKSEFDNLDLSKKLSKSFWENFPSRKIPKAPSSRIKVKRLQQEIRRVEKNGQFTRRILEKMQSGI